MSWVIIFEDLAQLDLDEAFIWYEEQSQNLGFRFIDEIDKTVRKILRNPCYASIVEENVRGASLEKFPFAIIYLINEQEQTIYVLAISHHRKKPGWFRNRL